MSNMLTVIIPIFNTEKYIDRCVNSVLNQTEKKIQIILINDASTDNTSALLEKYIKLSNVLVINNKENIGQGLCRNIGLSLVKTKYFCFLDSDDWVDTNAYRKSIAELEQNDDCDIAVFGIKTEYNNSSQSTVRYQYEKNVIDNTFALSILSREYAQDEYISALLGNKIFRSKKFLNKLMFQKGIYEDTIFTYKAFVLAHKVILLNDVYLHYYQRNDSIMHIFTKNYIDDLINNFLSLKSYLINSNRYSPIQYFAFFEKCSISMLNGLFSSVQAVDMQKFYVKYFICQLFEKGLINDIVDYMDINRFKKIFYL